MKYSELLDALDGLHAYDGGTLDSGIHDESLRERCREYLQSLSPDKRRVLLAKIGRDLYLDDNAIKQGYGLEDIKDFTTWLDDYGMLLP